LIFPPKIIAFTGTRRGMTPQQKAAVDAYVALWACGEHGGSHECHPVEFHHGDAIGADAEFHEICLRHGWPVVLHPSNVEGQRAFCRGAARVEAALFPLERNAVLVAMSSVVLAAPAEMTEQRRGGTWSTIRNAWRNDNCVAHVILPDGSRMQRPA
jgi:hypothetical protein